MGRRAGPCDRHDGARRLLLAGGAALGVYAWRGRRADGTAGRMHPGYGRGWKVDAAGRPVRRYPVRPGRRGRVPAFDEGADAVRP